METTWVPGIEHEVGRVALGTWSMGGWMWGGSDETAARATIGRALDLGIDLIDTAPAYGFGLSERMVGETLSAREDTSGVVVATKCGLVWDRRHEPWKDATPDSIRREVFESLDRLGRERIDLYQVHWPDPATPVDVTGQALCSLREEGLIAAVGVCNFDAEQLRQFAEVCPISVCQSPYNLFQREIEAEVLPAAADLGATLFAYSPLARGLLTDAMRPEAEPKDEARRKRMFHGASFARHVAVADRLQEYAQEHFERSALHLALRWILDGVEGSVVLWGARKPEQLEPYDGVWGWQLDQAHRDEVERIVHEGLTRRYSIAHARREEPE
jgi:aryl-alcohol dehydrogenase-like predicted oxidoreductase